MALDVARLIARLEVDDSKLTKGLSDAQKRLQQLDASARDTNQSLQRIEIPSGIARAAQDAQQQVAKVEASAREAGGGFDEMSRSAQRASTEVGKIGDNASGAADSGKKMGTNFVSGFKDTLGDLASKTGPVAGSLIGIAVLGVAAGALLATTIQQGMQQELSRDIFQAQTGVTEAQARKFALAAGEAYADAFGESVQANLSTLKLALQNNILDPASTQRDAEKVVADLDTISIALDSDVSASVKAVSSLMSTGLAGSASEAADMIANVVGGSANKGEDLLDVIWEYSAGWKNAGISAEQALALIEQATDSGAFNADVAGDALREFGRRMTEESDDVIAAMDGIGLNGEEMFERLKRGGSDGNEAFDTVLDALRGIEDQTTRNAAAAALLGDTSGDFYDVFTQWDPSTALANFGEFEGAAGRLAGIMGDNSATSVTGAMRSIGLVADGLKGALAEAFGPKIQEFASAISNNRAGVIEFFTSLGNGAFEAATAILGFAASGLDAFANVTEMGTKMVVGILKGLAAMASGFDVARGVLGVFGVEVPSVSENIQKLATSLETFSGDAVTGMKNGATAIREDIIPIVEEAHGRFQEFAGDQKLSAAYNDQSQKMINAAAEIGIGLDGASIKIENWTGAIDRANVQQVAMENGLKNMTVGFRDQIRTGIEAGETVESLTGQYAANREALVDQLVATGLSTEAASAYLDTLGLTPTLVETQITQPGMPEAKYAMDVLKDSVIAVPDSKTIVTETLSKDAIDELIRLGLTVTELPNGKIEVTAQTEAAERTMQDWLAKKRSLTVELALRRAYWEDQGVTPDIAGTIQGPVPMTSNADGKLPKDALIAPGRGRGLVQWAEAETEGEAFIPMASSKRRNSLKIWAETGKRLGALAMEDGGIVGGPAGQRAVEAAQSKNGIPYEYGALDCSGYQSLIYSELTGKQTRFVTGADFAALGFKPGADHSTFTIGTDGGSGMNGHMAGSLFGVPVESGGAHGTVAYGGPAADENTFTSNTGKREIWHLPRSMFNPPAGEDPNGTRYGTGPDGRSSSPGQPGSSDALSAGSSGSGDGSRVFVTNWPTALGGGEKTPIATFSAKMFGSGGIEDHSAQISSGMRIWAEPETQGEAYIPFAQSKRQRSLAIWAETGKRLGVAGYADGGGFGGYSGPDTEDSMKPKNWYDALALGTGLAFTAASGLAGVASMAQSGTVDLGNIIPSFDTGSNSIPGLDKLVESIQNEITTRLDALIAKKESIDLNVEVDTNTGAVNAALMRSGIA
ncbi:phage tail tape measure protein [Antrihabitans spumae]|uniref:Phage tail tape measure protein n=1 Tax=Antrihabitans spumae TaxID=3373370 RepID=A0ABW7KPB4_9NOCA